MPTAGGAAEYDRFFQGANAWRAHRAQEGTCIQVKTRACPNGSNSGTPEVVSVASASSWNVYHTAADTVRARDAAHTLAAMNDDGEYGVCKDLLTATENCAATGAVAIANHKFCARITVVVCTW